MVPGLILLVVFIAVTIGCVFWGLSKTAGDAGYGKQLMSAVVIGVVAGILILILSLINLNLLFPNYIEENNVAMIEAFEGMNMPEQAFEAQIAKLESRTAMRESINGMIGTVVTTIIAGAIVAIFKRKK